MCIGRPAFNTHRTFFFPCLPVPKHAVRKWPKRTTDHPSFQFRPLPVPGSETALPSGPARGYISRHFSVIDNEGNVFETAYTGGTSKSKEKIERHTISKIQTIKPTSTIFKGQAGQSVLSNIPEDRRTHFHRGGGIKITHSRFDVIKQSWKPI